MTRTGKTTLKTELKCYKLLLWKRYFDTGFSLTNYFKYLLLIFGWATDDVKTTIIIGIVWAFACLILGRLWFHYRLIDTEQEIMNIFNPFQREVRAKLNGERFK